MRTCDLHFLEGIKPELMTKFIKDIKSNVKDGSIKTEKDAVKLAEKYLIKNPCSYHAGLAVVLFLDKNVKDVISIKKYKHPYFKGKTTRTLYTDKWGRVWSKTVGMLKNNSELKLIYSEVRKEYTIDTLGGMMWRSKRGKTFICQYRTSLEETKGSANPETFIG